jgi:hypothetical protein
MNRRTFLKKGVIGSLLLLGSGVGMSFFTGRTVTPRRTLNNLSRLEFSVLVAVARRTVTAPAADPVEIAHRVDDFLLRVAPETRTDFKRMLVLLENPVSGLFLDGRPWPFTRLSPEAQDRALFAWRDSSVPLRRAGYVSVRKVTQAAHYEQPSCWASVGYPGPPTIAQ